VGVVVENVRPDVAGDRGVRVSAVRPQRHRTVARWSAVEDGRRASEEADVVGQNAPRWDDGGPVVDHGHLVHHTAHLASPRGDGSDSGSCSISAFITTEEPARGVLLVDRRPDGFGLAASETRHLSALAPTLRPPAISGAVQGGVTVWLEHVSTRGALTVRANPRARARAATALDTAKELLAALFGRDLRPVGYADTRADEVSRQIQSGARVFVQEMYLPAPPGFTR